MYYEIYNTDTGQVINRGTWYASRELGYIYPSRGHAKRAIKGYQRRHNNNPWFNDMDVRPVTW